MKLSAIEEITIERERQIEEEGWTAEHDDKNRPGDLAMAAACYAVTGLRVEVVVAEPILHPEVATERMKRLSPIFGWLRWPYGMGWWKPKDRRRDLIRAGALIVAEIERLDRAALSQQQEGKDR